jgi:hypothetical protein
VVISFCPSENVMLWSYNPTFISFYKFLSRCLNIKVMKPGTESYFFSVYTRSSKFVQLRREMEITGGGGGKRSRSTPIKYLTNKKNRLFVDWILSPNS